MGAVVEVGVNLQGRGGNCQLSGLRARGKRLLWTIFPQLVEKQAMKLSVGKQGVAMQWQILQVASGYALGLLEGHLADIEV